MKQSKSFMYIASFLALTIPVPGRFVFGLTIILELFLLEIMGILLKPQIIVAEEILIVFPRMLWIQFVMRMVTIWKLIQE